MSAHLTEEEQIETLKRWWADNGKSLVVAVIIGVGGYMGFGAWKENRQVSAEQASSQYEQITELLAKQEAITEAEKATVGHLALELKSNYADTLYGVQASMLLAKQAVEAGDLAQAEMELRWALEHGDADNVLHLARVRLARVLVAEDKATEALSLLNLKEEGAFASLYAEIRGDIYAAQQNLSQAAAAYQTALSSVLSQDRARADQLRIKLNGVQPVAEEKGA